MKTNVERFFVKNQIRFSQILYIIRQEQRTAIHLTTGEVLSTYLTLKDIQAFLPEGQFVRVNKSYLLALEHIVSVENGLYTASDGRTFQGRGRTARAHQAVARLLPHMTEEQQEQLALQEQFSTMDAMPFPFCVMQLEFDCQGKGADLILRCFNQKMKQIYGGELLPGQSFYERFPTAEQKWLVPFVDVALNGKERIFSSYSPELDRMLTLCCYQTKPGFCACMVLDLKQLEEAEQI